MNGKQKILLVEDDTFVSDIYQMKLGSDGFETILARDGAEAMKLLDQVVPDLVLLDIIMPNVDGIAVLRKLKSKENLKTIPVILLTNISDQEKIDEAMDLGANDYLVKSHFTPSEVISKVRALLKK